MLLQTESNVRLKQRVLQKETEKTILSEKERSANSHSFSRLQILVVQSANQKISNLRELCKERIELANQEVQRRGIL